MRIQFYPIPDLERALINDATNKNIPINNLIHDILLQHYGLSHPSDLSMTELENIIFSELAEYVKGCKPRDTFDLSKASQTYKNIHMVYSGKPSTKRASLGKIFNNKYVGKIEPFLNVEQVLLPNGQPKRTTKNRAAIYIIKEGGKN